MKTFFLLLAMLILSINLHANPPDSCLKMICDDGESYFDTLYGHWVGSYNPDSVRVDSCEGSATFEKLFTKRYFYLQFQPNYYPFDSILKPNTILSVSEISSSKTDLKLIFQQLESQLGSIYFQGLMFEEKDSITLLNPVIRVFFSDYQNIQEILDTFKSEIDTLKNIIYEQRYGQVVSIQDLENDSESITLFPNPVKNTIELKVLSEEVFSEISIYNLQGEKVYSTEFKELIDVSFLTPGVYFIYIGNMNYKFVKL